MPPNPVPAYQHGRNFYVMPDELERIRPQRRQQMRKTSAVLPNSVHRSLSNPPEQKPGLVRLPPTRLSRSILKVADDSSSSSLISFDLKTKSCETGRAHSSDRILEQRQSPPSDESKNEHILRPSSTGTSRRAIPTSVADYGISPSLTSTDQTYSQSNASKLTSYFVQMKPSNKDLNSTSGSLSEDSTTSLLMLVQQRSSDTQRYRHGEIFVDHSQSKDSWTDSTTSRTHLTDISNEKKRVRFADMEGFTLETSPTKTLQRTPINATLLTRRKQNQSSNAIRRQTRPVFGTFFQTIVGVTGGYNRRSKLATDV